MNIQRIEEFLLTEETHIKIQGLFRNCFPDFPKERSYYKLAPDFRYLVWKDEQLIAQMGVDYRSINVVNESAKIFGVVDLGVSADFQSQKIASNLLSDLEKLGKESGVDFLVLVSGDHSFYEKHGFQLVQNTCRWLMVNEHQTLGVGHRRIDESLMVKAISDKEWKSGLVDFLGHIF